jgi:thioredoxin-related protein
MKQFIIFTYFVLSLMLFSCNGNAQSKQTEKEISINRIEVLDFHSTHRCITCNAIETNTKYTLNTFFAKELASGKITFQSINVDEEVNYKIAEKFEAAGTSLYLNVVVNGKEAILDLTEFAFSKGRDEAAFSEALKVKIEEQLKKL